VKKVGLRARKIARGVRKKGKKLSPLPETYEPLLARVERPGRYAGGEINAVVKDPASLRATIALAFPDLYDVGMSYHGFRILYERVNARSDFAAERVFTPWPDFADALRATALPLTTLETFRPLGDVEVIGFTLQHELNYTNVLEMLDLARVPLRSSDRASPLPLIVAGGEGAYSPEPMAEFIDAFVVGDGEEVVFDLLEAAARAKEERMGRAQLLRLLARIPGVYVPSLYRASYKLDGTIESVRPLDEAAPPGVRPRVYDIARDKGAVRPVVPLIRTVQDRTVVEVRRGCVNGCRFCQAGMIARPVRERPVKQVRGILHESLANTGDDSVSLLSLSTADYTELRALVRGLNADLSPRRISVALPSLRISSFDVELAAEISAVRKSGFTFAPEAGSERLRRIINKPLDEGEFLQIIEQVLHAGWKTIKMYFMIGLPGETDADLDGIVAIVRSALDRARELRVSGAQINITISPFVPKSHTPFQWEGQIPREEIQRRMRYLRDRIPSRGAAIKTSPIDSSVLEAALARADRRMGAVIEHAWRAGCRFDGWSEQFRPEVWWRSFAACGLDAAWYACRPRADDEMFPYDHILSGPGRKYLAAQRDLACRGETTPDCVNNPCSGCDACDRPKRHVLARDIERIDTGPESPPPSSSGEAGRAKLGASPGSPRKENADVQPPQPVMRARLRFTKSGSLRFIAHLDLVETIHRLLRRSEAPLAYSHGFNPLPQIALSPPMPLGFEGSGELADVRLLERIDLGNLLRRLASMPIEGLAWTGAEEAPLKAPSLQQAIAQYLYRLRWRRWGDETAKLPLENAALSAAVERFMESETWPIEILRKDKTLRRDARAFVLDFRVAPPPAGYDAAAAMTIRSDNGVTLSPLAVLEGIFGSPVEAGVLLRVVREPIEMSA